MGEGDPGASALVEIIYEAAIDVRRWAEVLDRIARRVGARGAMIMNASTGEMRWTASPGIESFVETFFAEGWHLSGGRADHLIAEQHPGFRVETDYMTAAELSLMPVQRDFLAPHGMIGGAGTLVQGLRDDVALLTFEGFQTHEAAGAAVPFLDELRPHLGRSLSLAARMRDQAAALMIDALSLAGIAAAVIGSDGNLRACNAHFEEAFAATMRTTSHSRDVRFQDQRLQEAVHAGRSAGSAIGGRSVPLQLRWRGYPTAAHVIPLLQGARDFFESDGVLVVLASSANAAVPGADLLRLMFDLTPAEARLARSLLGGLTVTEAARRHKVTPATARRQLAAVFQKTGINRQVDLLRILSGLGTSHE